MTGFIGFILVLGLIWGLPIFVSHKIGSPKRRAGWAYGLLLGWLGVVVIACLGPKRGSPRLTSGTKSWSVERERPQRSPLPKSELKRAFAVFAIILLVGLVGIGAVLHATGNSASATPPPTLLSQAQFVRAANGACFLTHRHLKRVANEKPRTLKAFAADLRLAIPSLDHLTATISRLAPPRSDWANYRRMLNLLAEDERGGRSMLHFIETRQIRSARIAAHHVDNVEQRQLPSVERKLGLTACVKATK